MGAEENCIQQGFPATHWSLIDRARQPASRRDALATLLLRYLPALRAHLLAGRRVPPDRIDDTLQAFVTDKVIEQNLLALADRQKGRFRSFLLSTFDRYVVSARRAEHAAKRRPKGGCAALTDAAEQVHAGNDPADHFNVAWARELIAEALRQMQAECTASGRHDLLVIFEGRVTRPCFDGLEPVTYKHLVAELNLTTPLQACRLLTTAKRMFARTLRDVVAEYAGGDAGPEAELDELREILARGGAQSGNALRSSG